MKDIQKEYTVKEVVNILIEHGYEDFGWKGSHYRMIRNGRVVHIPTNDRINHYFFHVLMNKARIDWRSEGL